MEDLTKEYENTIFARSLITNIQHNVLMVALDHMHEHLDDLVGDLETFEEENTNLKRIAAVNSLQKLFRL